MLNRMSSSFPEWSLRSLLEIIYTLKWLIAVVNLTSIKINKEPRVSKGKYKNTGGGLTQFEGIENLPTASAVVQNSPYNFVYL